MFHLDEYIGLPGSFMFTFAVINFTGQQTLSLLAPYLKKDYHSDQHGLRQPGYRISEPPRRSNCQVGKVKQLA
jgi:hypothetical protein